MPPLESHDRAEAAIADELTGVSVAYAHIGAAIRSLPHDEVVVLISDLGGITRVAGDRRAGKVDQARRLAGHF